MKYNIGRKYKLKMREDEHLRGGGGGYNVLNLSGKVTEHKMKRKAP